MIYDRTGLNIIVDERELTGGTSFIFERELSLVVPQPDIGNNMVTIQLSDSITPDDTFNLVGYVDFVSD